MTGELTLSGRILPIGGVKEKVLAARRAGVSTVLLPARNREHLEKIDEHIRREMDILLVDSLSEVVEHTLMDPPARAGRHFFTGRQPLVCDPHAGS
jgi:ATP-dependent Lon protease